MTTPLPLRALHLFPKFPNGHLIEEIRRRYDPLAGALPFHATIVFPFRSPLTTEDLKRCVEDVASSTEPFVLRAQGITGHEGKLLFLNIKVGNDRVIALHDDLYSGALARHLDPSRTYVPHITVGALSSAADFTNAVQEVTSFQHSFEGVITEITCERVGADDSSTIEFSVPLADEQSRRP